MATTRSGRKPSSPSPTKVKKQKIEETEPKEAPAEEKPKEGTPPEEKVGEDTKPAEKEEDTKPAEKEEDTKPAEKEAPPEEKSSEEKPIDEKKEEEKSEDAKPQDPPAKKVEVEKSVTVEACKQWGAFKTRAAKISKGVGSLAKVVVNAEKPGRGNFVVKVAGVQDPIVELIGMKRPFPALKALDMDEVVKKVLASLE